MQLDYNGICATNENMLRSPIIAYNVIIPIGSMEGSMYTVIYRKVGENVHILNYTTGEMLSFRRDDGIHILLNMGRLPSMGLSDEILSFFLGEGAFPDASVCRPELFKKGRDFHFPPIASIELYQGPHGGRAGKTSALAVPSGPNYFETHTLREIELVLDDLLEMGVFIISLCGKDPFQFPHIQELLELMGQKGFLTEVHTDLTQFPSWFLNESSFTRMIGAIRTPLYSLKDNAHDAAVGVKGAFKHTIKTIKRLVATGYRVEVTVPLLASNLAERSKIADVALVLGAVPIFVWPVITETGQVNTGQADQLDLSYEQFATLYPTNPEELPSGVCGLALTGICAAGQEVIAITTAGNILPCPNVPIPLGNLESTMPSKVYAPGHASPFANSPSFGDQDGDRPLVSCAGHNLLETSDPDQMPIRMHQYHEYVYSGPDKAKKQSTDCDSSGS